MRIKITFMPSDEFSIQVNYNSILQAIVYKHISHELAAKLHDNGFPLEGRKFKLFTFSRIFGDNKPLFYNKSKKTLTTDDKICFVLSSPIEKIVKEFASSMAKEDIIMFGKNRLRIDSISVMKDPEISDKIQINMLSPITLYSTFQKVEGKKTTYYYNPFEREFCEMMYKNLLKKFLLVEPYTADDVTQLSHPEFTIEPIGPAENFKEQLISYKNFIIKGYLGKYILTGNPGLLKTAYHAGVGVKNSQGFGCFEII